MIGAATILLAAALAVWPQVRLGDSCGHDFDFHLVSWFDALSSWRQGILYPHWTASANYGAGEPRFVFYPPLTWMLGAALGTMLAWPLVPIALTFLLLAGTGLATRALARQRLEEGAATLAGCAALFSGYALFTAYERTAFAELAGGFWIPLVVLFVLRNRNQSGSLCRRTLDGSAAPLAIVIAGCWLSNAPVGVMSCYLLAGLAVVAALLGRSAAPLLRAVMSMALGMGLAAIYLVPAAWEQRWVNIGEATDDPAERIENSWLFAHHADPALAPHDTVLFKVSVLGASMIALALICLLIFWLRGRLANSTPMDRRWWISLALIPIAILFLQLPVSLPVWNLLPKLRFLQFPWRWLVVLEAPMAILFAAAVWPRQLWRRALVVAVCAICFFLASHAAAHYFFQSCDEEDNVLAMQNVYRSGAGFLGTDEYTPRGGDNSQLASGLPSACFVYHPATTLGVLPGGVVTDDAAPVWSAQQSSCVATFAAASNQAEDMQISAAVPHSGYLILRRRNYPAWMVKVNGQQIANLPNRSDGLIAVPVPQGAVSVTVHWHTTTDVAIGRWISALAVLLLTALWLWERKLNQPRLS